MKRHCLITFSISLVLAAAVSPRVQLQASVDSASTLSTQTDMVGPVGSEYFGYSVTVLSSGNIVVTDPFYDAGPTVNVGAVYLYDGGTGALISASRSIIYAHENPTYQAQFGDDWKKCIEQAVIDAKVDLANAMQTKLMSHI